MAREICDRFHATVIAGNCPWCGKSVWKEPRSKPQLTLVRFRRMIEDLRDADIRLTGEANSRCRSAVRRFCAIIDSMTPFERRYPSILDGHRIHRIAAGSGTSEREVVELLKQFSAMVKMVELQRR